MVEAGGYSLRQLADPDEVDGDFGEMLIAAKWGLKAAENADSGDPSNLTEEDVTLDDWMVRMVEDAGGTLVAA